MSVVTIENTIIMSSETQNAEQVTPTVIKRIRKKKNEGKDKNVIENEIDNPVNTVITNDTDISKTPIVKEEKVHKKRGRKPKGGKIIINNNTQVSDMVHEYNIILHLKCSENDLVNNIFLDSNKYDPNVPVVETFQFENSKGL